MNTVAVLLGTLLFPSSAFGQVRSPGKCPDIPTVRPFKLHKYLGTWYGFERFFSKGAAGTTCSSPIYTLNDDGSIHVLNRGIRKRTGEPTSIEGVGVALDPSDPARLSVRFNNTVPFDPDGNYLIVKTDYVNFAVVYSCDQKGPYKSESVFIIQRKPRNPRKRRLRQIYNFLKCYGVNPKNFIRTNLRQCRASSAYKRLKLLTIY